MKRHRKAEKLAVKQAATATQTRHVCELQTHALSFRYRPSPLATWLAALSDCYAQRLLNARSTLTQRYAQRSQKCVKTQHFARISFVYNQKRIHLYEISFFK